MKAYFLTIKGDVQGVFYRHNAKIMAEKLKISGWVKNTQDGSVEALIQGEESDTKDFIVWANEGSPMATVEDVKIEVIDPDENIKNFIIK